MKAYERLLKYVAFNTPCDETSNTTLLRNVNLTWLIF